MDMEEDELLDISADFGRVLGHSLWQERGQKCGWLEYGSMEEAKTAFEALDNRRMVDWHMRVKALLNDSAVS